ncbi:MAG: 3-dehydroquinate synthase [Hellea sp.]|nr:3-dehydroquinate synthase [Hellea sp.]
MSSGHRQLRVALGPRSYDIIIGHGLTRQIEDHLAPIVKNGRLHIVTDQTVHGFYKDRVEALENASVTVLPPGESQKSFAVLQHVLDDMFAAGLGRGDTVAAFGGGVIGDLTGFAASIYKRGCQFVQIPTTLLAQVDSSVGGKTAINVAQGKNLVGAFYQPALVLADTELLVTLPERQLKAGYAEVVKYGLLGNAAFFKWLDSHGEKLLALDAEATAEAIATSCRMKAEIVAQDEREQGVRALLNLGHTFGHALEAEAGFGDDLLHGEAVSAGMEMAFQYSAQQGLCSESDAKKVSDHFQRLGLTGLKEVAEYLSQTDALMDHMGQDKKNESGRLTLILARGIGEAFIQKDAPQSQVRDYLQNLV